MHSMYKQDMKGENHKYFEQNCEKPSMLGATTALENKRVMRWIDFIPEKPIYDLQIYR